MSKRLFFGVAVLSVLVVGAVSMPFGKPQPATNQGTVTSATTEAPVNTSVLGANSAEETTGQPAPQPATTGRGGGTSRLSNPLRAAATLSSVPTAPQALPPKTDPALCDPNYVPCVPLDTPDMTCALLGFAVTVKGDDIYQLDEDGDGIACESYTNTPYEEEFITPLPPIVKLPADVPEGQTESAGLAYPWANYRAGTWTYAGSCSYGDDIDPWGMCYRQSVSYAAWRTYQTKGYMPPGFGDAKYWDDRARARGILVDDIPRPGDVAVSNAGTWGHVMYVESVNPNGTINISQYNARLAGEYSEATISAAGLVFIHF